jgi:hypothetical protein
MGPLPHFLKRFFAAKLFFMFFFFYLFFKEALPAVRTGTE